MSSHVQIVQYIQSHSKLAGHVLYVVCTVLVRMYVQQFFQIVVDVSDVIAESGIGMNLESNQSLCLSRPIRIEMSLYWVKHTRLSLSRRCK